MWPIKSRHLLRTRSTPSNSMKRTFFSYHRNNKNVVPYDLLLYRGFSPQVCELLFEGAWKGEKKIKEVIKRGEAILIPYTYSIWAGNPELEPAMVDMRPLPFPKLTALWDVIYRHHVKMHCLLWFGNNKNPHMKLPLYHRAGNLYPARRNPCPARWLKLSLSCLFQAWIPQKKWIKFSVVGLRWKSKIPASWLLITVFVTGQFLDELSL